MLWYKSWLDTRSRFLIGLAVLMCAAAGIVLTYPSVAELLPMVSATEVTGEIGRRIKEAAEIERDYRGYVWYQWFRQNMTQLGTLFAVLLGSGSAFSEGSRGAALFTLSLPASRRRLLGIRTATGLVEFFVLAVIPSLFIPLLSPAVGETFGVGPALVHGLCLFVAGATFFSLACLLSTVFSDIWRPVLVALLVATAIGFGETVFRDFSGHGLFGVMRGEVYFRTGELPWPGLLASAAASAAMLYGAASSTARRDF